MVIIISVVVTYLSYYFNIVYAVDLTLLSIAIIFPLVFTIRGSFRRREKALEHLSEFRSTLKTVKYFFMINPQLDDANKERVTGILHNINDMVLDHLGSKDRSMSSVDEIINEVYNFVLSHNDQIPRQIRDRVFRFMKNMHESIENLHAIHIHRTPISLKAYCKIFIYIFPCIYAPTIISNLGEFAPVWITYFVVILTEFILISLYNIQMHLEYPFDNVGVDDIDLDNFRIDR
ncbi:MAG: hypothetical protein HKN00_08645 [Flavobacteriaceae bacterium]|nr:hypothetical protein [Bacteroidia bacterium]NNF75236.1 hypothetical protein [Flavobacteriaceae bacterium]NNK74199.1 hypothetical protein [Flavobacteriaceae bacterium]